MVVVSLNLTKYCGTRVTGGHRSSNGWVTSWTEYTYYRLTASEKEVFISIKACNIIKEFLSRYRDVEEKDQDWGVYIDESQTTCNIDLSPLIKSINEIHDQIEFDQSAIPLEYSISELLSFSEQEYNYAVSKIRTTERELQDKIELLKVENENLKLQRIYPHLRNLIINNQVDFQSCFAGLEYYPVDIIAKNHDIELLIQSIVNNENAKYECINDIYTELTTKGVSYHKNVDSVKYKTSEEDGQKKIWEFIKELEDLYGVEPYGINLYGNSQYFKPKLLKGMIDTVMYYLLKGEYETYFILLNQPIYKRQNYIFNGLLKFAYLSDAKWDKLTFGVLSTSSDEVFFRDRFFGSICTHTYWKPFLERILRNQAIIEKLAQIYFFKDEQSSKERLVKSLSQMIERCNTSHENYPFYW